MAGVQDKERQPSWRWRESAKHPGDTASPTGMLSNPRLVQTCQWALDFGISPGAISVLYTTRLGPKEAAQQPASSTPSSCNDVTYMHPCSVCCCCNSRT